LSRRFETSLKRLPKPEPSRVRTATFSRPARIFFEGLGVAGELAAELFDLAAQVSARWHARQPA
jgi:hypothetical protein